MFMTLRDGLASMLEAIAGRLPAGSVQLQSPVERLHRQPDGTWQLDIGGAGSRTLTADAVVVATQAPAASRLLEPVDRPLGELLGGIHHSGCAIVTFGIRRDQIAHRMDGFGFVVPAQENRKIISGSFSSVKYEGRAPEGHALVRVFIGGALQAELLDLDDDQLRRTAWAELRDLMGLQGEPSLVRIVRYPASMPQYYVGHEHRVATIEQRAESVPGLFLTGNAYHGVGIPLCIRGAERAAEQVCRYLQVGAPQVDSSPTP
jgi:oxygen-dependent protoporphyrinogen oxidase